MYDCKLSSVNFPVKSIVKALSDLCIHGGGIVLDRKARRDALHAMTTMWDMNIQIRVCICNEGREMS